MIRKVFGVIIALLAVLFLAIPVYGLSFTAFTTGSEPVTTISEAYIPSETSEPIEVTIVETERVESTTELETTIITETEAETEPESIPIETEEVTAAAPVQEEPTAYEGEYAVAHEIWNYMKNLGWSDVVCAGIMGNLMAEVGGQTLNIQYTLYDATGQYYGMCQWYGKYCWDIFGADLQTQCDYLRDTIKQEIDNYGYIYQYGHDYEQFLQITDPAEAALAFAAAYERCGSAYYNVRQTNAIIAYNYFVG